MTMFARWAYIPYLKAIVKLLILYKVNVRDKGYDSWVSNYIGIKIKVISRQIYRTHPIPLSKFNEPMGIYKSMDDIT